MIDVIHMTTEQSRKANSLIKQWCANYDAALNNCIALDDGTAPGCPQMLTHSLLCKYFKNAVLPTEPGLEVQIMRTREIAKCSKCGAPIAKTSNRRKYCDDCAKAIHRKQQAQYAKRRRIESTNRA